jgi:toxin ParE1/3/4
VGLVRRTPSSKADYRAIWDYVAADNPDVADRLLRTLDAKVQFLSDFPHVGRRRPELRPRLRSFPVGNYIIFYRPLREGMELIRVLHGARDVRRQFRGRG